MAKDPCEDEMMNPAENATSYRICAAGDERWDVLRGSSPEPVATFTDKHAAIAYAMSLARTRSSWQPPLDGRRDVLGDLFAQQSRGTRGTRP